MRRKVVTVTGASGFIGGHVVTALLRHGYAVRAMYRRAFPPQHLINLQGTHCSLHRIDLTGDKALEESIPLLQSSYALIHAAAQTGDWGKLHAFLTNNYNTTVTLLEAAQITCCNIFVHVGTIAVHGFGNHEDSTEEGPYYPLRNPYQISKQKAEKAVIAAGSENFRTTVIRPGNVYGPGDTTTSFPLFDAIERGLMGYLGSGKTLTCPVYIDDLVEAIIKAMEKKESGGEIFNISGPDKVTWEEYLSECANLLGKPAPKIHLAPFVAKTAAAVLQTTFRLFRVSKAPPITFYRVHQLINNYHFSSQKAQSILGYYPTTDYKTGLTVTVKDYLNRR